MLVSGETETSNRGAWGWVLTVIVVVGLAIDAFVHIHESGAYSSVGKHSTLNQGQLFYIESALAIIAGILLLIRARIWTALIAFLVSGGGFALVLIYQYVDVGAINVGPLHLPDMYDNLVYGLKTLSIVAEGVAAVLAFILIFVAHGRFAEPAEASSEAGEFANTL